MEEEGRSRVMPWLDVGLKLISIGLNNDDTVLMKKWQRESNFYIRTKSACPDGNIVVLSFSMSLRTLVGTLGSAPL